MAVTARSTPYDARRFPMMQFDYRVPEGVKTNLLVKVKGRWYEFGFTDDRKELRDRRVNIAYVGNIPNVVADDRWHTARFDLYELLRTKTGNTVVDEIVMADWDVGGYMKLQFGSNLRGATYYLDNFWIGRGDTPGLLVDRDRLPVNGGEESRFFTDGREGHVARFVETDAPGAVALRYWTPSPTSFAGQMTALGTLDLRSHHALALRVRDTGSAGHVLIGLADRAGREHKVPLAPYVESRTAAGWQQARIPLAAFESRLDLGRVSTLVYAFTGGGHPEGVASFDDVHFVQRASSVRVDDFDRAGVQNLLGGMSFVVAHGAAAVNGTHVYNSPNGIWAISYGGNIGGSSGLVSGLNWALWGTGLNGIDCSRCGHLTFRIRGQEGGEQPNIYLSDGNFKWGVDVEAYARVTQEWQRVTIPLAAFARYGVDLTHLQELQVAFEWKRMSGTVYVDDVGFGPPAATSH